MKGQNPTKNRKVNKKQQNKRTRGKGMTTTQIREPSNGVVP